MSGNTGLGATLVFTGGISYSGFRVRSIGNISRTIDDLEDTALDASGFYEMVPDDLAQVDSFDVEVYWDGTKDPPLGNVGTITINFPKQANQTTAAKITGSGYINRVDTPELAAGQRLTATLSIKFDGKTGPAYSVAI